MHSVRSPAGSASPWIRCCCTARAAAWANNEFSVTVLGVTLANSQFHSGWTVGGGAEWAFAGPWSAKAEYMFARYNQQTYFAALAPPGLNFGMDVHTVKAGINYRFGWGGPVAARY